MKMRYWLGAFAVCLLLAGCGAQSTQPPLEATPFLPFDTLPPAAGSTINHETPTPRPELTIIPIWTPKGGVDDPNATPTPVPTDAPIVVTPVPTQPPQTPLPGWPTDDAHTPQPEATPNYVG